MPMIVTSRTRTRQPPNPTRLSSSPLARGLVYAVGDLTSPHEAAAGRRVAHTDNGTAPSLSSTGNANAIRIAGAGFRSLTDPAGALRIFSGPMTVAMFARVSSLASSWGALWTIKDASSPNAIWSLQRNSSTGDVNMETTGGANFYFLGAVSAVANNAPQLIVVSRTGVTSSDTASLWAGGSKFTSTTTGGGGGSASNCSLSIGAGRWGDGISSGDFGAVLVWNRALSDVEVASLRENPWQLFAPVRRPVFFVSAGGVYDVALSESASASDSLGAAGALTSALAEAASAADVVSAAAAFAAAMSEVATATDGTAAVSVVLGALTEGGTGVDTLTSTISGAGVYDVALLESATTADAETAGGVFYVSVSEQGVGSEALSTGGVFYVTLADSGTGTDVLSGHLPTSFSAALSESVSALDVMVSTIPSAGTLWTAMDTAAASGWTAVATTTNTWTIVPTT